MPRPQTVPAAMTGKFVAWTPDGLRILGHGDTPEEARSRAGGEGDVLIEWIPPAEELRCIPLEECLSRLPQHEQDAIEALAAIPAPTPEEKAERELWDCTLMDGLEEDPYLDA